MNTVWSKYIQGTKTLYYSRQLRFDDLFAEQYKSAFLLDSSKWLRILEIGCGPGALAGALHRWYPNAVIVAVDRDSEFIRFARENEKGIEFIEGDATALPFKENTFDVVISNTVAEHIEPEKFYGEQLRVLKPGGVCLVLSSRKGIQVKAACTVNNEYERRFWEKAQRYDDSMEKYEVCRFPMSEAEMPMTMEKNGLSDIRTGYALIDLTPDDPRFSSAMAYKMIEAARQNDLEGIESVFHTMPEHFAEKEICEMKRLANMKYDIRKAQYDRGEKQWDTSVSVIMILRGVKPGAQG